MKSWLFLVDQFDTFNHVLRKMHVNQGFGKNDVAFYKNLGLIGHNGIDYRAAIGTKTFSAITGTVSMAFIDGTGGIAVRVQTDPIEIGGVQYKLETIHYHLNRFVVRKGKRVKAGEVLGETGNTGKYTTGPHLHFGLKVMYNEGKGWTKDYTNGFRGAIDPAPFFEKVEQLPVDRRYERPMTWIAEFNMRFKNRWLHRKFYDDLKRHPLSISDRELKALVYGGWDYETVFKQPELFPIWSEFKKAEYLSKNL